MFNEEISFFKNVDSPPKTIKLQEWINVCLHDDAYKQEIEDYRNEYNALKNQGLNEAEIKKGLNRKGLTEFKRSLPLVTVGAVCEGGRSMGHVTRKTGWIALDIDGKDNPHIANFEAVRDELSKNLFVAFSCLSVGGKGVWLLVKVEQPVHQEAYFQQLVHDFRERGIFLDRTKGKNANDARFYSFDPNAKIRDTFKVYDRLPTLPKPKPVRVKKAGYTEDVFVYAKNLVMEKYGYTFTNPGDMHCSLFHFCSILNYKGVPQKQAEEYIDKHLFKLSDITTNCISGPYEQTEYHGAGSREGIHSLIQHRVRPDSSKWWEEKPSNTK